MADHNAIDSVSRRNVLKTAGGLLAGATAVAGQGSALPDRHGPLRVEIEEANEEVLIAKVASVDEFPEAERSRYFLGLADDFVHQDEGAVSLPADIEGLATPVEVERIESRTHRMYFRVGDVDWPKEYEGQEVTLGLGLFSERTVPRDQWATDTIQFDHIVR